MLQSSRQQKGSSSRIGERGLQINAGKTPDVVAVDEEEQEEAKKLDYESLDRLIDSQYLGIFLGNGSGQG